MIRWPWFRGIAWIGTRGDRWQPLASRMSCRKRDATRPNHSIHVVQQRDVKNNSTSQLDHSPRASSIFKKLGLSKSVTVPLGVRTHLVPPDTCIYPLTPTSMLRLQDRNFAHLIVLQLFVLWRGGRTPQNRPRRLNIFTTLKEGVRGNRTHASTTQHPQ